MTSRGITRVSEIRTTAMQFKMLRSQMRTTEIARVFDKLTTIKSENRLVPSDHLRNKKKHGFVSFDKTQLADVLSSSDNIVEVNSVVATDSFRVLLRGHTDYNVVLDGKLQPANLCVVVELTTGVVVTAYFNKASDNHDNLNQRRYTKFNINRFV
jgi:hypothetical protein